VVWRVISFFRRWRGAKTPAGIDRIAGLYVATCETQKALLDFWRAMAHHHQTSRNASASAHCPDHIAMVAAPLSTTTDT